MNLTKEQQDIVNTIYNENNDTFIVNAFAGTGKTTTVAEVMKEINKANPEATILYLTFNKKMADEADEKFNKLNIKNVKCYTTHAFALMRMMKLKEGKIKIHSSAVHYDTYKEVTRNRYASYKSVSALSEAYTKFNDTMNTFCRNVLINPSVYSIDSVRISKNDVEAFKKMYEIMIEKDTYSHGMYLKEYALNYNDIITGYDYVFLDEAQDLNPLMLLIVKRIKRNKIWIVGDRYQQIYTWNNAINALNKFEGINLSLSESFRLNDLGADLANRILSSKYPEFQGELPLVKNVNNRTNLDDTSKETVLFRKNSTMFLYAIDLIKQSKNIKVHFLDVVDGKNADSFDEIFKEMLFFFNELLKIECPSEHKRLENNFTIRKSVKQINDLIKMADNEDETLVGFVRENYSTLPLDIAKYFSFYEETGKVKIVDILCLLRDIEYCENPDKEYWLCTAHRSKGLEWDNVKIAMDDWDLRKPDETNLLYVACTRSKCALDYSEVAHLIPNERIINSNSSHDIFTSKEF